ncbi:methyl-CpG-binding domain-containing protein 1-like [Papaver somniferum]|uniref:methyl-CpG-binding domain-containing protein 1-like n=1 Tax=Papaver somniferum TaxID=3469 RepID=UPI000E6F860B|nr:methyl-CpG-binding domain-containing protein 1-like [Papaver somniferum]
MEKVRESSIGAFAVQCGKCEKWRLIPTQEEYEEIRANFIEKPWFCDDQYNVDCDDPADIELDNTRTWVIDKPNLPKSPAGFERGMTIRSDHRRLDVFYRAPGGKKVRSPADVEKFLETNPDYKAAGVSVSDFKFISPKIMENTIPEGVVGSSQKRMKMDDDFIDDM